MTWCSGEHESQAGWGRGCWEMCAQPWKHVLCFSCRINGAVIKGFEEDVGTKVSFYGFTVNTMKNSLISYEEYGFTQVPQGKVRP